MTERGIGRGHDHRDPLHRSPKASEDVEMFVDTGAGFHEPLALLSRETPGEFDCVRLKQWLQSPVDVVPFFERPVE